MPRLQWAQPMLWVDPIVNLKTWGVSNPTDGDP